jgi:hypothetical protein
MGKGARIRAERRKAGPITTTVTICPSCRKAAGRWNEDIQAASAWFMTEEGQQGATATPCPFGAVNWHDHAGCAAPARRDPHDAYNVIVTGEIRDAYQRGHLPTIDL